MKALLSLGFGDIRSVEEVRALSRQPTEPTAYVFSPGSCGIDIARLDWSGNIVSRAAVPGEPHALIPPIIGPAAERVLYPPMPYVISAQVREGGRPKPVVAVLFIKPQPGKKAMQPDKKTLGRIGLCDIQSVERVSTGADIRGCEVYLFERTPAAKSVSLISLGPDGSEQGRKELKGEPHSIIPRVSGSAADRFVNPRGAPGADDFPRQPQGPAAQRRRTTL
jgi:hypothetical protein